MRLYWWWCWWCCRWWWWCCRWWWLCGHDVPCWLLCIDDAVVHVNTIDSIGNGFVALMRVYGYMHVYMYACMYACIYVCMHVYMHACMYACMYVCIHVCMYANMHVKMYACTAEAIGDAYDAIHAHVLDIHVYDIRDNRPAMLLIKAVRCPVQPSPRQQVWRADGRKSTAF